MKFRLVVRSFTENDINHDCPFEAGEDDFQMYLNAFTEDIENLDNVSSIVLNDSDIEINIENPMSGGELKEIIRPLFDRFKCNMGVRQYWE